MGQTVNLLVYTFGGSNPSSPTKAEPAGKAAAQAADSRKADSAKMRK